MAYTIDTHAAVRDLTAAGFPAQQAEAIVATVSRADDAQRADLATKADLIVLKGDLAALKAHFNDAISSLEIRLLKWGVGIALAVAGLLFAALQIAG